MSTAKRTHQLDTAGVTVLCAGCHDAGVMTAFDVLNDKGKPSGQKIARFIYDEGFYNMDPPEFVLALRSLFPRHETVVSPSVARRLPEGCGVIGWRRATGNENKFGNKTGQAWVGFVLTEGKKP